YGHYIPFKVRQSTEKRQKYGFLIIFVDLYKILKFRLKFSAKYSRFPIDYPLILTNFGENNDVQNSFKKICVQGFFSYIVIFLSHNIDRIYLYFKKVNNFVYYKWFFKNICKIKRIFLRIYVKHAVAGFKAENRFYKK
ncbi:MAG: hypothetical protein RRY40_02055, partial [Oscillospiraceae bacterium]